MNFLHFATFLFVICSLVLVAVSLSTPAPGAASLHGLTFAHTPKSVRLASDPAAHNRNVAFSIALIVICFVLWAIFF